MRRGHGIGWVVGIVASVGLITGCAPSPEPTSTPTGFASEEEAFAAAETTYRAYVDALNDVDLSDPATFEPVYALLDGAALDSSKTELTGLHADKLTKSGPTVLVDVTISKVDLLEGVLVADICLDVSEVDVRDSSNTSVVPESRADHPLLAVTFESVASAATQMKITASEMKDEGPCR
jgi:hypothetical protein